MTTTEQHIENLRDQLNAMKEQWGSHLDFWDFIARHAGITCRSAYNFASGAKRNPRFSTIQGIESALTSAEHAMRLHRNSAA